MSTTKASGLGWSTFTIADASSSAQDLRDDITDLKFSTPRAVWDVTGIGVSAYERILTIADVSYTVNGVWDPGANLAHAVLSSMSSTSVIRAVNNVVGGKTLATNCWVTDYQLTRATGGAFDWSVPLVLADGVTPAWS